MKKIFFLTCLLLGATFVRAQDYFKKDTIKTVDNVFIIRLKDGTRLKGKIIEQNTEQSKIQTQNMGLVIIPANQIVGMDLADKNRDGSDKPYYENRYVNRFFYIPTGFPMIKGDIDYYNCLGYYNEFSAALGSRFSVGLGTFIFPYILSYNIKAKATLISNEAINFSVSGHFLGFNILGLDSKTTMLIIPSLSIGKKERFFNISPIFFTNNSAGNFGLSLSYMKKTTPNLTFFTENIILIGKGTNTGIIPSVGFRFDRKRHAFDINIGIPIYNTRNSNYGNNYVINPIPSVGYHLKLSK